MTTEPRRVVVTGLGATTPVGGDVPSTWEGLLAGRSGVRTLEDDRFADLPVRFAGQVAVDPSEVMERPEARKLDRSQQLALIASREAWKDAGSPEIDPLRLGVAVATGIGGIVSLLDNYDILNTRGWTRVSPMSVPQLMPNGSAAWIGLDLGAQAGIHTPVSACASGAEAVGTGLEMIRSGRADIVMTGGTEACIHPITIAAFAAMRALSTRNDDPAGASRPYDLNRDGFVMGEGAGMLVLEDYDHAVARGATIYAEVAGVGLSADGHHIAQPEPEGRGATRAIRSALEASGLAASDIIHVNAHATSTPQGDGAEALAIRAALGSAADGIAVSGTKSMTGHLLGGAGAVESVAAILALRNRVAPVTANLEDRDDSIDLDVVFGSPRALRAGDAAVLNNSFGFGGHNVALIFRSI
ncbi:beta-ketoacyl-ACP synthase II [Longivirga aurantiaca]|uniref:3-oxoacyl-[acyl-carrier-protein] synthase 2 n=1 Tax=Longivirga aurantiaca TaxID=1837743 RepID=A0ABW1T2L8_9ACTN